MSDPVTYPSPPPPQPASLAARCLLSFFGLILMGAGGFFTYQMWQSYQRSAETYRWLETPCLIVSSTVEEDRLSLNTPVVYIPTIQYSYLQGEVSLMGKNIKRVAGLQFKDKSMAEEMVRKYPQGQGAKCYVNPDHPQEAILIRDSKGALYSIWFPFLFVIGGLGMLLHMWWPAAAEELAVETPATEA